MTQLDVSFNKLLYLPFNISKLKALTSIDARNNDLSELPSELCELKELTELRVGHNSLTHLPTRIYHLTSLKRIEIDHNLFMDKPSEYKYISSVKSFDMSGNPFETRNKKILHRDAVIRISSNVNAKVVNVPPSDTDTDKYLADIDSAKAAVMSYEQQRAAWKAKTNEADYSYDKLDSSVPASPPVTHRHHFRLGIFQMRLGMSYFKKVRSGEERSDELRERINWTAMSTIDTSICNIPSLNSAAVF